MVVPEDLEHLDEFGLVQNFRLIKYTALASKMRVFWRLGSKFIKSMATTLKQKQLEAGPGPLGEWHDRAYVHVLLNSARHLKSKGITVQGILRKTILIKEDEFHRLAR